MPQVAWTNMEEVISECADIEWRNACAKYNLDSVTWQDVTWDAAWSTATQNATTVWATSASSGEWTYQNFTYQDFYLTETEEEKLKREAVQRARDEADKRAEQWLISHLNSNQKEEYAEHRQFTVYSKDRERRYAVTRSTVYLLDEKGREIKSFCIHPEVRLPIADEMCCKKLLLETDEEEFLRISNHTEIARIAA